MVSQLLIVPRRLRVHPLVLLRFYFAFYNLKKGCSASGVRSGALFKIGKCSWPLFTFLHFRQVMKHDDNVRNPMMQYPIIAILESLFIFHLLLLNVPDGDIGSFCLLYIRECVLY